jgi:hypothetical protein
VRIILTSDSSIPPSQLVHYANLVREKIEFFQDILTQVPETSELTSAAKSFISATLKPVTECVRNHHGNNPEALALQLEMNTSRFKKVAWTKFSSKHCKGIQGAECSL